ncbi:GUN4 domain-containing protein [Microcoleus sp. Pol10D4]|uniref:GUN4 domain-containing protein n=1 Tax=Microcoleus sp. Pol10D4 TaxID=3055387 RepID=UPI002FD22CB6
MWILILIVLAVVVYFVVSQASSSNQPSKASSQNYTNQVDYSNLEVSLDTSASNSYGCDYRRLRDLLAEGKWREADEETNNMILRVTNYNSVEDFATPITAKHTPCEDICTIDRLWLKYSNGRFGLSVQRRILLGIREDAIFILLRLPSERKGNYYEEMKKEMELESNFNNLIEWYAPYDDGSSGLKSYNDITFSIQAPYGHLPTANPAGGYPGLRENKINNLIVLNLLKRLSDCGIAL